MEEEVKIQIQTFYDQDNLFEDMVSNQHPIHYYRFRDVFPFALVVPISNLNPKQKGGG